MSGLGIKQYLIRIKGLENILDIGLQPASDTET